MPEPCGGIRTGDCEAVKPRVIVVDDDPAIRNLCARILGRDYDWQLFASPDDARDSLVRADLVITDLQMPGGGGLKVIEEVRGCGSRAAVLVITGLASSEPLCQMAGARCSEVLAKPFAPKELREAVTRCLGGCPDSTSAR